MTSCSTTGGSTAHRARYLPSPSIASRPRLPRFLAVAPTITLPTQRRTFIPPYSSTRIPAARRRRGPANFKPSTYVGEFRTTNQNLKGRYRMFAKYVCLYVALPLQPLCSSSDSTKFQARSFDDENANLTAAKIAASRSVLRRRGASPRSNAVAIGVSVCYASG